MEAEKLNSNKSQVAYTSQDGFVNIRILRGFTEIESLFNSVSECGGFICGGYVRWMCSPRKDPIPASDVDIYCPTFEIFTKIKEQISLGKRHENEVSFTFNRPDDINSPYFAAPAIQLIKPMREGRVVTDGPLEEIISNFDFSVIRLAILDEKTALADADYLHDELRLILRLKNIHCPVSSTLRCCKYAKKGYWLPPTQALRLFIDWDNRDEDYKIKLLDFLDKAKEGEGLSQKEIDELEAMMRID